MIAIVDYKAGNLTSVKNAFDALGVETVVTRDPAVIASADRVVFPGVGAAASAMANLKELGLVDAVKAAAGSGRPFLGICLGMQILFEHSEEDGGVDTLGILKGRVRRFPDVPGCKVPEIGWNSVEGTGAAGEFYFVHSYYAEVVPETNLVSEYAGVKFTAMVAKGSLWACQFHPEKSGRLGLDLLARWLGLK
ncbi:MAG: imidazole glycerol phosphate synthase subunit HisH [Kiritimatiellae bacterium]|nr:imidazole glycerol phosphate synthase subunit HisH [Kiritimatiellia bacterium]